MTRWMASKVVLFATLFLTPLLISKSASASVVTHMDLETLVQLSPVIVRGEVESIVSGTDSAYSRIHTYVTIRVDESLKGAEGSERVTLRLLGGSVGEQASVVFGMPSFRRGERVVLFARPAKSGALVVSGLFQGKFPITSENGLDVVEPQSTPERTLVINQDKPTEAIKKSLAAFLAEVRGLVELYPGDLSLRLDSSFAAASQGEAILQNVEEFNLFGPARWFEPDSDQPVPYSFNPMNAPGVVPDGARNEFVTALGAWNQATGASIVLTVGVDTTDQCFIGGGGVSSVSHNDPCNEMPTFGPGCSGVLALGGFDLIAGTTILNGVPFFRIGEGDVVFNAGADCFWAIDENYEEVVGHEIAHTFGLRHSCDAEGAPPCAGNPTLNDSLLRPFAHGDGRGARLGEDDIDGLRFIYPPDAFVEVFLNQTAFSTGQTMDLSVDVNGTAVVDAYVAVVLPSGMFFTIGTGGVISVLNGVVPMVTSVALGFFPDVPIFSFTFTGAEPAGTYTWFVILVPTGADPTDSANWIASDQIAFTFGP